MITFDYDGEEGYVIKNIRNFLQIFVKFWVNSTLWMQIIQLNIFLLVLIWFGSFAMPARLCYLHLPVCFALSILICATSYLVPPMLQSIYQLRWPGKLILPIVWEHYRIWTDCWIKIKFHFTKFLFTNIYSFKINAHNNTAHTRWPQL